MARHESLNVREITLPAGSTAYQGSLVQLSLTPAAVATIVAPYQNVTIPGVRVGDLVIPMGNPISNNVALVAARVASANTVALQFVNPTAGSLTPTAGTYSFLVLRTD
jgi:hypothetical protein